MATAGVGPKLIQGDAPGDLRAHRSWTPLGRALAATGDRWTLMIVLQLGHGKMRLTQLQGCLPGVSTGVLERYVQQMVAIGLISRTRYKEMPPRVELELTPAGKDLLPVAGELARWGMRHMWSAPREQERIDVHCLLRLLPVLLEGKATGLQDGSMEAVATLPGPRAHYLYEARNGRVHVVEGIAGKESADLAAKARVEGTHRAWLAALGPEGDFGKLRFSGDEQYALDILGALHEP